MEKEVTEENAERGAGPELPFSLRLPDVIGDGLLL